MANDNTHAPGVTPMYIVGIDASAGGLEALQELFKSMPDNTGAAFVVAQHRSPDYKSLMGERLSRCTTMPVHTAEPDMAVQANTEYLIPPRKDLYIRGRRLQLRDQNQIKGVNLAIDEFLRSLAADCEKYAIAIILSGAGSDGTLSIRSIREAGGMIMAQDPKTAKFSSIPDNAIATGLVDFVMAPGQMVKALVEFINCRNMFIYLKPQVQQDLLDVFYYALNPGGILFLENSETVGEGNISCEPVNSRWKIFRQVEGAKPVQSAPAFSPFSRAMAQPQHGVYQSESAKMAARSLKKPLPALSRLLSSSTKWISSSTLKMT